MEGALQKFNRVIESYKERIGTIGQERERYKAVAQAKFSEIEGLIDAIGRKIADLEQRLQANATLVKENEGFKREIEELNKNLVSLQEQKTNIERQIVELQKQNAILASENDSIKQQINNLKQELNVKTAEISNKNQELTNAKLVNDGLNKEINDNITLINATTQQLEQELAGLNVDNNQIDIEILRKLEELKRKLTEMSGNSGAAAAAAIPIFDRGADAAKKKEIFQKNYDTAQSNMLKYFLTNPLHELPIKFNDYNSNSQLKTGVETLIKMSQSETQKLKDNSDQPGSTREGHYRIRETDYNIVAPTNEKLYEEFKPHFPYFLEYWKLNTVVGGNKPKSNKRKTKSPKGKRINKMGRKTIKRKRSKPFRGGWTYKGSPSLDSKSSVITESSKTKSGKTRSNKSKSNKKHKSKKVIRRYKR